MRTSPSFGRSSSKLSNYSRGFDLPEDYDFEEENNSNQLAAEYGGDDEEHIQQHHRHGYGAMLSVFLNDLRQNDQQDLVEVTLELDDDSIVVCSVAPTATPVRPESLSSAATGVMARSVSNISRTIRRKFPWIRSAAASSRASSEAGEVSTAAAAAISARDARRMKAKLTRTRSSAQRALNGLRFINKSTTVAATANNASSGGGGGGDDSSESIWRQVESKFDSLAKNGLLSREDFGECIGMVDSREFAVGIFDALARRRRQKIDKLNKEELRDFWLQISDQSFDARLQIFFEMADSNEDGRITRDEVQELIMLSASANKLGQLKERADEYASLIMEELDPENLGYIELWQLEELLLQRDTYMNYSRSLSVASLSWNPQSHLSSVRTKQVVRRISAAVRYLVLENWRRGWVLFLWIAAVLCLFCWKSYQYSHKNAFHVMGYCLPVAKGAGETLKLNMALVLFPVCRNTLTWLRSTRARSFIPFDDNINFHKMIASAIAVGIIVHAGTHLACDFPRLVSASPEKFALVSSDFKGKQPSYKDLLTGIEGFTGISMVAIMTIVFTLATGRFRRNVIRLPPPFNKLTGFNAFWYSHHLLALVYVMLFIHGNFLYLAHEWYQKTTWMYLSVPLVLYMAERSLRTCRSEHYSVKILKVSVSAGNVFNLIMSKPTGFKYKSGQYIFLQCPTISQFEWHPFSITSAPGDDYLSLHIRIVGDWTQELHRVFTEGNNPSVIIGRAHFGQLGVPYQRSQPKLFVDGPYGAPAQYYRNYDVLLLVGLGIGATPFISILRDLINTTRSEEQLDSNTEASRSDDSTNSFTSSSMTSGGKKKSLKTTNAHFYWVTREPSSFEWFKGVMDDIAEMDHKGQIEMHNYLTSVYEEGDARSTLITMVQALNHAKHGYDILSGTRVRTHFARPNWKEVFTKIASKHPHSTVGVFYCGMPVLAKELKKLSHEMSHKTTTRFEFHKEYF